MSEADTASSPPISRFWAFAGTGLVVGSALTYCLGVVFHTPVMFDSPIVGITLVLLSLAFGLWSKETSLAVKVGTILWIVLLAIGAPIILVIVLDMACAVQNSITGHYVCGI
ncbi:MAG: hypothetical protein JSR55_00655 [Proteobacteria bacterium]|nr:hypothetical protein [Pseudomonadota bacterium]